MVLEPPCFMPEFHGRFSRPKANFVGGIDDKKKVLEFSNSCFIETGYLLKFSHNKNFLQQPPIPDKTIFQIHQAASPFFIACCPVAGQLSGLKKGCRKAPGSILKTPAP